MTEPAPATSGRRDAWVAAAVLAIVSSAVHALRNRGEVLAPLDDSTLLLPIAMREVGIASYAGDEWLARVAPVFSVPYSWIVGTLLRWFDDPVVMLRWLALPFHVVFLAGTWRCVERFGGRVAAILAVVLCALPPYDALVLEPGAALPRDLVFALVPWFVVAADAATPRRSLLVFLALGLVANLHPLTALHAVMWLLLLDVAREPGVAGLRRAAGDGVAFGVGAVPYVVQYLKRPAASGAVDETVYRWRLGAMAGETFGEWATRIEPLVWLAAGVIFLHMTVRRRTWRRPYVIAAVAAVVLAAAGPSIGRFIPALRGVQLARFERFAYWAAAVAFAGGVVQAMRERRMPSLATGIGLAAFAFVGPLVFGDDSGRGPLGRVGRAIDRRAGVPFEPAPPDAVLRFGGLDPTNSSDRPAFLQICAFAREHTPADALFLVPPEHWGPFRVYARRGVVVTRKEGGAALSFLGGAGMEWFRDYAAAVCHYGGLGRPNDAHADDRVSRREWDYTVLETSDVLTVGCGDLILRSEPFWLCDSRRK